MRSSKFVSAFVALILGFSLIGLVAAPAQAAKPKHDATFSPDTAKSGQLFVYGKVSTYPNGTVTVQRKNKGGVWKLFAKADTNSKGKYRANVEGPSKSCFRLVVPKTADYKRTVVSTSPDGFKLCLQ